MLDSPVLMPLLDLDSLKARPFSHVVWRIAAEGVDPLQASREPGRWDTGSFDIIDTSLDPAGAHAEKHYHLSEGGRRIPVSSACRLYEIDASLGRALIIEKVADLAALGVDPHTFGCCSYEDRDREYADTRRVAEAAYFLGFEGLIVPSARWACHNAIIFRNRIASDALALRRDHGCVDWAAWEAQGASGTSDGKLGLVSS